MGSLNLPSAGLIYVDTAPVIYSVEKHADFWALLRPLWMASKAGQIGIVSSELVLLETLVGPLKAGDVALTRDYEQLFASVDVSLIPITANVLRKAAQLRAATGLKTPGAIHAATALASGCVQFITNDSGLRRVSGLNVVILRDLLTN
ncbi:MAG TPA: type II toxin-antitoxin system VapC family toxin [Blastocatellia bacterium]|nr:type II toxin-antitoxin system VapC family toxin [Blastocatellia bacterium]